MGRVNRGGSLINVINCHDFFAKNYLKESGETGKILIAIVSNFHF